MDFCQNKSWIYKMTPPPHHPYWIFSLCSAQSWVPCAHAQHLILLINKSGPDWPEFWMRDQGQSPDRPGLNDHQASSWSNSSGTKPLPFTHHCGTHTPTDPCGPGQIWPDRAYLAHRPLLFRLLGIFIWDLIPAQNVLVQKTHRSSKGGPGFGPQTPAGLHHHLILL